MNKRRRVYGKVFKSHLFGTPTIVSTDAEVSRFILQSDAKTFVPSYPKSLTELMGKSSILLINGSLHRRIHGLIGAFFKSPLLKAQITKDMERFVGESMRSWTDGRPIYIQDEAKNISFQILVKALISIDPAEDMEFLKQQFQKFISGLMSLPLNLPGTRLHRSLQAKDSVPILITLAVKYLSDCPAALQQLREENMELKRSNDRLGEQLCWTDYLSLPFTQSVITETLRMGNIIIGVMRKAVRDVEIRGYLIPKGWCAFAYFRLVHLDESHYDRPYEFYPWRWQDKDTSSCNFTPFGGGQRLCPGLDLARLEASIFLHHLVTQFSWVAEEDRVVNFPTVRMKRKMPIWVKSSRLES
ncbi:hypothetical protein CRG98_003116 [Punica granatum]|uniref:3-epi-6-deoxocathasterone 23-monooxygenase n=1 Tax=Punica granatum TaxID=22663 RepID=A0A2I0L719_PUNGR|nr:hypothetical protein CRG98_003116 [Punica granatum]